jgi:hypothetical protein
MDGSWRVTSETAETAGHACLLRLAQGTVCKILDQHEVQPHKVRYYLERRDEAFEQKMAEVLCVYRKSQSCARAKLFSRISQSSRPAHG